MSFTKMNVLGIGIAIITCIIIANGLNLFFGLDKIAQITGLLIGLEAGFWTGAYQPTKAVHQKLFEPFKMGFTIASYLSILAVSIWLAVWIHNEYNIITQLNVALGHRINGILIIGEVIIFFLGMITIPYHLTEFFDVTEQKQNKKVSYLTRRIIISGTALLMGILLPALVVVTIALAFLFLALTTLGTILGALLGIFILASKHETMSIAFGGIAGSLAGLSLGWTNMEFQALSMAMVLGIPVGLVSGWVITKANKVIPLEWCLEKLVMILRLQPDLKT